MPMRPCLTLALILLSTPALAHIGHLGEVAGHGHLIGIGAIGLAGLVGLLGARKGKKGKTSEPKADPKSGPKSGPKEQPA